MNGLKGGPGDLGQEGPAGTGQSSAVRGVTVEQPQPVVSVALAGLSQLKLKQEG